MFTKHDAEAVCTHLFKLIKGLVLHYQPFLECSLIYPKVFSFYPHSLELKASPYKNYMNELELLNILVLFFNKLSHETLLANCNAGGDFDHVAIINTISKEKNGIDIYALLARPLNLLPTNQNITNPEIIKEFFQEHAILQTPASTPYTRKR